MKTETWSVRQQRNSKTYERNQIIVLLVKSGARQVDLANRYGLSEPRISQIIKRNGQIKMTLWERIREAFGWKR